MNRSLILAGLALALGGCQPVADDPAAPLSGARDAVPVDADWRMTTRGGSADLNFSEVDGTEDDRLFHLACRLNTQQVQADWQGQGDAILTSGTATGTFRKAGFNPADHPVFTAFRANGTLSVGRDDADLTLTAHREGRAQIAAFFDFCTRPLPPKPAPEPVPAPPAAEDVPPSSEADDQPDDRPVVEPVEPGVDVVQPDKPAQEPVDG